MSRDKGPRIGPFYGYPAELLAEWCLVDVATARRWKRGTKRPSARALKLFELRRDRRLLPEGWLYNERTGELVIVDYDLAIPLDVLRAKLVVEHMTHAPVRDRRRAAGGE